VLDDHVVAVASRVPAGVSPAEPDRPGWWREIALGLAVFAAYLVVDHLPVAGRGAAADAHGRAVLDLERALHLDVERALNHWLAPHHTLRTLANYEYATTYVLSAFALLFWVYRRRPGLYRQVRTSFVWVNVLALACFALYPVRPPRTLDGAGFVDTVRLARTWGSWGSSALVDSANQVAAMPSLHVGWALWVTVVLARLSGRWPVQAVSAVHVLVTLWVIMATGNHWLLDAVGAAVVIWAGTALAARSGRPGQRVPAADAFFLHAERPDAPQHVGGLIILETATPPTPQAVAAVIRAALEDLPRFRQRLSAPSRWRRPRWVAHPDLDWDWHVPRLDVSGPDGPGGLAGVHRAVADLAAEPLPRDRPLWRMVVVTGVGDGLAALVLLVHHVVADGIGTVTQALHLVEPPVTLPVAGGRRPGPARRVAATVVGLAQLATDGRARGRLPSGGGRRFTTVRLPLEDVRALARRHGARVTDVLLCGIAGALTRVTGPSADAAPVAVPGRLRVAVPLMVREPGSAAEGNLTAAVMIDLPTGAMPEADRLAAIVRAGARLRTGTRAVASRFVMHSVGNLLPPPLHAWFARATYGRPFFHAIASNMPGADAALTLAGAPMREVYPIIPLAPGAPLAAGVLGWHGWFSMSIALDPALTPDPAAFAAAFQSVLADLSQPLPPR
jgi:diacylglycerol O-acyltransferase